MMRNQFIRENIAVISIFLFFIVVVTFFSISADAFFSKRNILNLLRQSAPVLIAACAMTFVITTKGIDLSIGSTLAIINALCAVLLQLGWDWTVVLVSLLFLGMILGGFQGYFIAYEGIPAFIVTLAGMSVIRGFALLMTEGFTIPISSDIPIVQLGRGWLFGMPIPALIVIFIAIFSFILMELTTFGRYVTGIGSNQESVRRSGVNVNFYILLTYMMTGFSAALGGIIIAGRLGSGSSNAGVMFELEVIAAVVLGGTNLFGGKGTIVGTILGALTIAVIGNGLILAHVSPFYTQIITGFIILIAIWINTKYFQKRTREQS